MSVLDTVKSSLPTGDDAKKPLFAVLGAYDLAALRAKETVKGLPPLQELPTSVQTAVTGYVQTLPQQITALREAATPFVTAPVSTLSGRVDALQTRATEVYGDLTLRGERVAETIRRQPATEVAEKAAKATARNAKATSQSAKRTVKAVADAASDAAAKIG